MNTYLALADLSGFTQEEIRQHVVESFELPPGSLNDVEFLIAYQSVGEWGCDSSAFYLCKRGTQVFEVNGSHCSCYGFEGQWFEEKINSKEEFLTLAQRNNALGGYDDYADTNDDLIKEFILTYDFDGIINDVNSKPWNKRYV